MSRIDLARLALMVVKATKPPGDPAIATAETELRDAEASEATTSTPEANPANWWKRGSLATVAALVLLVGGWFAAKSAVNAPLSPEEKSARLDDNLTSLTKVAKVKAWYAHYSAWLLDIECDYKSGRLKTKEEKRAAIDAADAWADQRLQTVEKNRGADVMERSVTDRFRALNADVR